jgi:4-hydroxythreonine-4-phosphate dehydrogenase
VLRRDAGATAREVRAALSTGPTVLSPDPAAPVVRSEAASVARLLAEVAAAALPETGTLVATGGETARAVLTHAGVTRLLVLGEVEPGIVRSRVPELDLDVVTKAGAFGDADALFRCLTAA